MAWSEQRKVQGIAELARRKAFENASTNRAQFLKWLSWTIFFVLMSTLFVAMLFRRQHWFLLALNVLSLLSTLAGLALTGAVAYVRFLDWRRSGRY